jgi:hypothetical protein
MYIVNIGIWKKINRFNLTNKQNGLTVHVKVGWTYIGPDPQIRGFVT